MSLEQLASSPTKEQVTQQALERFAQEKTTLAQTIEQPWTDLVGEIFPNHALTPQQQSEIVASLANSIGLTDPQLVREAWKNPDDQAFIVDCICNDCPFFSDMLMESQRLDEEHAELTQQANTQTEALASKDTEIALSVEAFFQYADGRTLDGWENELAKTILAPEDIAFISNQIAEARAQLAFINSLAETPEEAAIFKHIVATSRINLAGATPGRIFEEPALMITQSGLSDVKKAQALAQLGVTLSPQAITTATDLDNALDATTIDAAGNEVTRYTADQPLEYRDGMQAYRTADGTNNLRVELSDGRVREIAIQTDDPDILRTAANLLALFGRLEEAGIPSFMGESYHIETDLNQQIDATMVRKTAQVMGALLGANKGFNGEIISHADLDQIVWQAQYYSLKGDAATGDNDVLITRKNLADLRIRHQDGSFDFDVLKAAGSFMREQYGTGAPEFDLLKQHLAGLFPEKFGVTLLLPTETNG